MPEGVDREEPSPCRSPKEDTSGKTNSNISLLARSRQYIRRLHLTVTSDLGHVASIACVGLRENSAFVLELFRRGYSDVYDCYRQLYHRLDQRAEGLESQPMPDKWDEHDVRDEGSDPEVPIWPRHPRSADKRTPHGTTHPASRYISQALSALSTAHTWLWHKVLANAGVWTAAATVVIAVATVLYTRYAKRQWKAIGDELYTAGEAGRDSRKAQWAYVDIPQQLQIRTTIENGRVTSWTPEITMVNDGNTGTYLTLEVVSIAAPETAMPEDCGYPDNGKPQHSDFGPHEAELFDAPSIPIAAIRSVQNGGHVYIYGRAEYWDVFQFYGHAKDRDHKHIREFCYELRLDSATGDVTSPNYMPPKSMALYGTHNCTDGDCLDYQKKTLGR
jgi:hypothetical protein